MIHDFIKMVDNIDFLYGFIYECANLINNLYDYDNYNHLAIKFKSIKDMCSICSYLMNICCEEYFKLSQNEYLKIKKIYR